MTSTLSNPPVLPIHPVDPRSPIPLYHQVEIDLRALIESGALNPTDTLPPETELSRLYGVGRQTIRMALSRLVTDRLIARQAGRGTFILTPPDRSRFYLDQSFSRQMAEMGMKPTSRILDSATGSLDANAPRALHSRLGAPYLYLARLRLGDNQPIGLQYSTIVIDRCPTLPSHDFTRESLYDVLANQYHLSIGQILHSITAVAADATESDALQVPESAPLLQVNTVTSLEGGEVIEFSISYYRADLYEYSTTHTYRG
ncbi:MAG TPA: GntR family transcriptional regulator [Aggregatilineales bacterium]|nr:GntR family transcriptional regulator [Aggregatilineales bacterium]